jgi:hypothetical protein
MLMSLCYVSAIAQIPQAFNYQGIARNNSGSPLVNTTISLRISILQGTLPGTEVYQENHTVLTNKVGVFSLEVGHGNTQIGQFDAIEWGADSHSIQIEMDPDGGTNFTLLGASPLLSVPYALYAGKVSDADLSWKENGKGIHYTQGNVGIGTNSPDNKLSIEGTDDTGPSRNYLTLNNQSTSNRSLVALQMSAGDQNSFTSLQHVSETYDFEEDKYTDFGVLASTGKGLILRADATDGIIKFLAGGSTSSIEERMRITETGNVGIGTEDPQQKLTIQGENNVGSETDYLLLNNTSLGNRSGVLMALSAGDNASLTTLGHHSETYDFDGNKFTDFGQVNSSGAGLILRASGNNGVIKFINGSTSNERMRLSPAGNLGIGTADPASRLQVADGDVFIENINNGVIMKSPNGNCWRLTMNNDGSIKTTAITCPN